MSKLPHIGTSIFTVMSQMATEHQAINLSQGFPNFPVDERLTAILAKLATANVHQYTPMSGLPSLLEKIVTLTKQSYNRTISAKDEVLITAGATEGIFATIQALVKTNDEVIILDPSYDCYEAPILLSNAKPIRVALNIDFTPNWETINQSVTENTKLIIINNPHNPTGKIWTNDDFEQLEKLNFFNTFVFNNDVFKGIQLSDPDIHMKAAIERISVVLNNHSRHMKLLANRK